MKELNLIPAKYLQQKLTRRKRRYKIAAILAGIIFMIGLSWLMLQFRVTLAKEKNAWDNKLALYASYGETGQELDYIRGLCDKRESTARQLYKNGLDVPSLMQHLEKAAPDQMVISKLNVITGKEGQLLITVNVFLPAETDTQALIYRLEKDVYFTSAYLSTAQKINSSQGEGTLLNVVVNLTIDNGK